jgi:ATP-dependent DNA ligase
VAEEEPIVMLCEEGSLNDLKRRGLASEIKLDGTRLKVVKKGDKAALINRRQIIYTSRLPEITEAVKQFKGDFILDSEVVYINPVTGRSEFTPSQRRCSTQDIAKIWYLQRLYPVKAMVFDIMMLNGKDLTELPYLQRKQILKDFLSRNPTSTLEYVPYSLNLEESWRYVTQRGEEGLILKRLNSRYEYARSYDWLKLKHWKCQACNVVGYTSGRNARNPYFGSLVLADDSGRYLGCVGSGFSEMDLYTIKNILDSSPRIPKPFPKEVVGEDYVAVNGGLRVEIKYYKKTEASGVFRFPIFQKICHTRQG